MYNRPKMQTDELPPLFVEIAGTPFINLKDPLDNRGIVDFFRYDLGLRPIPTFFQRISDENYGPALNNRVLLERVIDYTIAGIHEAIIARQPGGYLVNWQHDVDKLFERTQKHDVETARRETNILFHQATTEKISAMMLEATTHSRIVNPTDIRCIDILAGGVFQAMVLSEMARSTGLITSHESRVHLDKLAPLAENESLVLVNLVEPETIARLKLRALGFNNANFPSEIAELRRNRRINEMAQATAEFHGHYFPKVKIIDLRKETARIKKPTEFVKIYARNVITNVAFCLPELAERFNPLLYESAYGLY